MLILLLSGFAVEPQSNLYEASKYAILLYPTEKLANVDSTLDLDKVEE